MDPAREADQSRPNLNVQFRRPWTLPSKRRRQRMEPLASNRRLETQGQKQYGSPDAVAQRARLGRLASTDISALVHAIDIMAVLSLCRAAYAERPAARRAADSREAGR